MAQRGVRSLRADGGGPLVRASTCRRRPAGREIPSRRGCSARHAGAGRSAAKPRTSPREESCRGGRKSARAGAAVIEPELSRATNFHLEYNVARNQLSGGATITAVTQACSVTGTCLSAAHLRELSGWVQAPVDPANGSRTSRDPSTRSTSTTPPRSHQDRSTSARQVVELRAPPTRTPLLRKCLRSRPIRVACARSRHCLVRRSPSRWWLLWRPIPDRWPFASPRKTPSTAEWQPVGCSPSSQWSPPT